MASTSSLTLATETIQFWRFARNLADAKDRDDHETVAEMTDELDLMACLSPWPTIRSAARQALVEARRPMQQTEPSPIRPAAAV